jgi:hypothetical protein
MNNTELVLKLFNPDENGVSRWVYKDECVGEYANLRPGNGNHWYRNPGLSHLIFVKETLKKEKTIRWKFDGLKEKTPTRPISELVRKELEGKPCAHTGFKGTTNNEMVIDHKNGRYNDEDVLDVKTQKPEDFQPLCNQANLNKRSYCNNVCIKIGKRFDAKTLGYGVSYIEGDEKYEGTCVGCYWADCIRFKKEISNRNNEQSI